MSYRRIAQMGRQGQYSTMSINQFNRGLNTVLPPAKLRPDELYACLNHQYSITGGLETRPGLVKLTNTAFPTSVVHMCYGPVNSTFYGLYSTTTKMYYLDGNNDPVEIGSTEGHATCIFQDGVAVILDSGYIKTWDGTNLELAYDAGTGTTGYQITQLALDQDTGIQLGNGTITRAGLKFTSQSWTTGFTLPVYGVSAFLKKVGSPTGNAVAKIYAVSGGALIATSTTTLDVSTLTTSYTQNDFSFDLSDDFDISTDYYAVIEYSGGSVPNHVLLAVDTVASGGNAYDYDGSWNATTTQKPCMGVQPGRPPKAGYGLIIATRLVVAGDPDNPGYVWYSNASTHHDWSTANGGGYIGVVDSEGSGYKVTAILKQYGNVYVFGGKEQPYLWQLSGTTPTDLALSPVNDNVWTTHDTALSVGNEAWFTSAAGTSTLTGVQEYGDLRMFGQSGSIKNIIKQYFDDDAIAAHNPINHQYILKLTGYNRVLVANLSAPYADEIGQIKYPWTEIQYTKARLTDTAIYKWTASGSGTNEYYCELLAGGDPSISSPTYLVLNDRKITEGTAGSLVNLEWDYADNDTLGYSTIYIRLDAGDPDTAGYEISILLDPTGFGTWNEQFYVAGDDGHIYYYDQTICRDNAVENRYLLGSSYFSPPFGTVCLERFALKAFSQLGADIDFSVYKDYSTVTAATTQSLNIADNVVVNDLDEVEVRDANFVITTEIEQLWSWLNVNASAFMFLLSNYTTRNTTIYFEGIHVEMRGVGR